MPTSRKSRYRGRRRTSAQRRPGHLCTHYVEDDIEAFSQDLKLLRSVWPESVLEDDQKAERTIILIYLVVGGDAPWWSIPIVQTFVLLYLLFRLLALSGEDTMFLVYREADRRGIKYIKNDTPLYQIMNRINADYNNHLWNRNFNWTKT